MGNVVPLNFYDVYEFSWGTAVKDRRRDKWTTIILRGREIDVTDIPVELHENGIEFV